MDKLAVSVLDASDFSLNPWGMKFIIILTYVGLKRAADDLDSPPFAFDNMNIPLQSLWIGNKGFEKEAGSLYMFLCLILQGACLLINFFTHTTFNHVIRNASKNYSKDVIE
ncbi:hypothetical protein ACFXTO_000590 [Malus domestica]